MNGPYDVTWVQYFWIAGASIAALGIAALIVWLRGKRKP